jgi:ABC-type glycerol-3-phosphate transport system substrate-binding protein
VKQKRWLLVVVLGALALIVAGCGGDNGDEQLTEEEFYLALEELDDEFTAANEDVQAELEQAIEGATSEEERVEAIVSSTEAGTATLEDFIDGVAELNPPDELTEWQDQFVSAGRAAVDAQNDFVSALGEASTEAELQTIAQEAFQQLQEPFGKLDALCVEAQGSADDAGVEVDYNCEDE